MPINNAKSYSGRTLIKEQSSFNTDMSVSSTYGGLDGCFLALPRGLCWSGWPKSGLWAPWMDSHHTGEVRKKNQGFNRP